jgi:hypothetical protein
MDVCGVAFAATLESAARGTSAVAVGAMTAVNCAHAVTIMVTTANNGTSIVLVAGEFQ